MPGYGSTLFTKSIRRFANVVGKSNVSEGVRGSIAVGFMIGGPKGAR
jgi:hypothetical protein